MTTLPRTEIEKLIPHRKPILLLDEVTDWQADTWLEAHHFVADDNPHFNGHFPGNPLLPGVLIVEAMAQAAAVLISLTRGLNSDSALYLFTGIEEARFKNQLLPNNMLTLRVEKQREKMDIFRFSGMAYVGEGESRQLAASATFSAKLVRK
ncbi:MAG: 3-hydroxyacyl-ACP dehydratase FabZ [Blastochloris viridis]|uniref:3-hydroxyacyl-[acyl-carrier-protein] dehydratase FabZ n=1 Tax=Blastochloris viridis TaxID=1079 RepID=A0A6N4R3G4_BLAVI|nr:MAG: 3-hydroxyacyl-ACP dehydratase FabZ [Blastochloris viridis]